MENLWPIGCMAFFLLGFITGISFMCYDQHLTRQKAYRRRLLEEEKEKVERFKDWQGLFVEVKE